MRLTVSTEGASGNESVEFRHVPHLVRPFESATGTNRAHEPALLGPLQARDASIAAVDRGLGGCEEPACRTVRVRSGLLDDLRGHESGERVVLVHRAQEPERRINTALDALRAEADREG